MSGAVSQGRAMTPASLRGIAAVGEVGYSQSEQEKEGLSRIDGLFLYGPDRLTERRCHDYQGVITRFI